MVSKTETILSYHILLDIQFRSSRIHIVLLPLFFDELRGRASIVFLKHSGKVQRVFIAAHLGDLTDGAAAGPYGGKQTLCVLHSQAGHVLQR